MFLGLLCPLLLVLDGLMVWRLRSRPTGESHGVHGSANGRERKAEDQLRWLGALAVLSAEFPLFSLGPWAIPEKLWGDAETHARVGRDIAHYGLGSGWLDGLVAGFPFAQHYPPLPWLALALEIELGLSPVRAIQWLGWLFLAATPLVVYWCLLQLPNLRVFFAVVGGLFTAWISPYNEFFGGYEVFFACGLISQTMGLPLVALWMCAVARRRPVPVIFGWSALAIAAHPQLSVAGVLFLGIGTVALGRIDALKTYLWSSAALVSFGVAIYGQGVVGLRVPFGWPEDFGWRHIGFEFSRLSWWLEDSDLFDQNGSGLLTPLAIAAWVLALPRLRRPEIRAAAAVFALGLLLSVSGPSLPKLGFVGALALKFIQPLRFVALLPLAAALLVAVVFQAWAIDCARFVQARIARPIWVERSLCAALLALLVPAVSHRIEYVAGWPQALTHFKLPKGYEVGRVRGWLDKSSEGRVWYDVMDGDLGKLVSYDGLSAHANLKFASTSAVGGHVGLLFAASQKLEPTRAGSDRRAEALGVRSMLTTGREKPEGWRFVDRSGALALFEHERERDFLGLGCIVRRYSGSNAALSKRLYTDLREVSATDQLLDPENFLEIQWSEGDVREAAVPLDGCSVADAHARLLSASTGRYRVVVESLHPVDVVVRSTYFPSFRFWLDGRAQPIRVVAPGFMAIRVPAGRHEIVADAAVWAGMGPSVAFSALGLAALGLGRSPSFTAWIRSLLASARSRSSTRPSV